MNLLQLRAKNSRSIKVLALALPLCAIGNATSAFAAPKVTINGKTASNNVKTVSGSAYVKLADIAKALGLVVVKNGENYELKKPGGTNQIKGVTQGKIGDVLFDGKWRFQALSMQTPASFTMKTSAEPYDKVGRSKFDNAKRVFTPSAGHKLVVIQCRVTNGVNQKRTLWTAINDDRIRTALTDTQGGSYSPVGYDFEGGPIQSQWLVPGAILNFPVIFSIPQNAEPKDLIFTLKNNQTEDKANDVRVALPQ